MTFHGPLRAGQFRSLWWNFYSCTRSCRTTQNLTHFLNNRQRSSSVPANSRLANRNSGCPMTSTFYTHTSHVTHESSAGLALPITQRPERNRQGRRCCPLSRGPCMLHRRRPPPLPLWQRQQLDCGGGLGTRPLVCDCVVYGSVHGHAWR